MVLHSLCIAALGAARCAAAAAIAAQHSTGGAVSGHRMSHSMRGDTVRVMVRASCSNDAPPIGSWRVELLRQP